MRYLPKSETVCLPSYLIAALNLPRVSCNRDSHYPRDTERPGYPRRKGAAITAAPCEILTGESSSRARKLKSQFSQTIGQPSQFEIGQAPITSLSAERACYLPLLAGQCA